METRDRVISEGPNVTKSLKLLVHPKMAVVSPSVVRMLADGLREISIESELLHELPPGFSGRAIVLGANFYDAAALDGLSSDSIILNVENTSSQFITDAYLKLLRRHVIWDFNESNAADLAQKIARPVHYLRMFYVESLSRISDVVEKDIDVLFYGSFNTRRQKILEGLRARGLRVEAVFGVFGTQLDQLIARSKVVINIHFYDNGRLEIIRLFDLLANGRAVVTELNPGEAIDADLTDALVAAPYERLVEITEAFVHDADRRCKMAKAGFHAISQRHPNIILRQALAWSETPMLPSDDQLRDAYLDLLAKCLTNQIYGDPPFDYWSGGRFNPEARSLGRDWPSQAMTMIGDRRLDNIRKLFVEILSAGVPGDLIETGVWRGGACIFMRGLMKAYNILNRRVWVADSFAGLPPPDPRHVPDHGDRHHAHPQLAVGLEAVKENFRKFGLLDSQVEFLQGWFADTLPVAPIERLALLRLDGDMYGSTMDALTALYDKVSPRGFVIVDDYGAVQACRAAITDFRAARGVTAPIQDIDGLGVFWQVSP